MPMSVVYTNFGGELVHENRGGVETTYISDPLGSVIDCRNSSGTQVFSATYWPYGEIRTSTGTNPSPFDFVGALGYYRENANRAYVRARVLRKELARWLNVDPLWPDEFAYVYASGTPTLLSDPTGWSPALLAHPGCLPPIPPNGIEKARCKLKLAECLDKVQDAIDSCNQADQIAFIVGGGIVGIGLGGSGIPPWIGGVAAISCGVGGQFLDCTPKYKDEICNCWQEWYFCNWPYKPTDKEKKCAKQAGDFCRKQNFFIGGKYDPSCFTNRYLACLGRLNPPKGRPKPLWPPKKGRP